MGTKGTEPGRDVCPECLGTGWFSYTPVREDGWPCKSCGGKVELIRPKLEVTIPDAAEQAAEAAARIAQLTVNLGIASNDVAAAHADIEIEEDRNRRLCDQMERADEYARGERNALRWVVAELVERMRGR